MGSEFLDVSNPLNAFNNPVWNRVFGQNLGPNYNAAQGVPAFQGAASTQGLQNAQLGSQNAMAQQQSFLSALQGGGLNANQAGIFGQQQGLANQLQMQAQGQGPNPAQAQLAQNTGQNVQQQAALMNSARGAQSNPGLVGREASIQGGNIQQQAAGQAATLGAQQQLAAQQNLMNQQNQMANFATAGVGQQQNALSQLGNQSLGYQQMLQQGLTSQNQQLIQGQSANVPLYEQQMKNNAGMLGGVMNGVGGLLALDKGGVVPDSQGPQSVLGQFSAGTSNSSFSSGGSVPGSAKVKGDSKANDTVPAMLSPGEIVIPRSHVGDPEKIASFLNGLLGTNFRNSKKA